MGASASAYTFSNQGYYIPPGTTNVTFPSTPKVILSLMGYQQSAPADTNTFVGFKA